MNWGSVSLDKLLWPFAVTIMLRATTYQQLWATTHQPNKLELDSHFIDRISDRLYCSIETQVQVLHNDIADKVDPKKKWATSKKLRCKVVRVYKWGGLGSVFSLNLKCQMPVFHSLYPNSAFQIPLYYQRDSLYAFGSCNYGNAKLRLPLSSSILRAKSNFLQMRWPII